MLRCATRADSLLPLAELEGTADLFALASTSDSSGQAASGSEQRLEGAQGIGEGC